MYTAVVVPIDPWSEDVRAVSLASAVARRCLAPVRLLTWVPDVGNVEEQRRELQAIADGLDVPATVEVHDTEGWCTEAVVAAVEEDPGALVCMSSKGRARTGSLLGSVAEDVLRATRGPSLLVGPKCQRVDISERDAMIVAVDGSHASDEVIGLGGSWAITFGLHPWIVTSVNPSKVPTRSGPGEEPVSETGGLHLHAERLSRSLGREVDWEVLHGRHPADELASFAATTGAAVIVMGTHGATGLARLVTGSVCAATVHTAPCPVLVHHTLG